MACKVASLVSKGVSAVSVCSNELMKYVKESIITGQYSLVFFTPETLILSRHWRSMLSSEVYQARLQAIVVDEAHTIYKWLGVSRYLNNYLLQCLNRGETFRSILLRTGELRSLVSSSVHFLAMTATATAQLR